MQKRTDTKWTDTWSICMAAVLIFMELSLAKSKNNFPQLVNKLCCFMFHIIRMLDGGKENAPQVCRQRGGKRFLPYSFFFWRRWTETGNNWQRSLPSGPGESRKWIAPLRGIILCFFTVRQLYIAPEYRWKKAYVSFHDSHKMCLSKKNCEDLEGYMTCWLLKTHCDLCVNSHKEKIMGESGEEGSGLLEFS